MPRGTFQFDVSEEGNLLNTPENVEALRRLWLNRTLVSGRDIGPGNPGDFDVGAWHVACHLAGAGGVRRTRNGNLLWLEISHDPASDEYYASVTVERSGAPETLGLDSTEGRALLQDSSLLGFIEGNSTGRISARGVNDPPDRFNLWQRQDFDQPTTSQANGGKVWEHWCTMRDIRTSHRIGTSVLTAYVSLVAALGDRFAPTVARGRRQYGHPVQLAAMVYAGFTAKSSALWNTTPVPIPRSVEPLFLQAEPTRALEAVGRLDWSRAPLYYMFKRRIRNWSPAPAVRSDLNAFSPEGSS
jgi:hypothetical protein